MTFKQFMRELFSILAEIDWIGLSKFAAITLSLCALGYFTILFAWIFN